MKTEYHFHAVPSAWGSWGPPGATVQTFDPFWQQNWERIVEPKPQLFQPKPYEPSPEPYGGDWALASGIGTFSFSEAPHGK